MKVFCACGKQGAFAQEGKQLDLERGHTLRDAAALDVINQLHVAMIMHVYISDRHFPPPR